MSTQTASNFISAILIVAAVILGVMFYRGDIGFKGDSIKSIGLDQSITLGEGESVSLRGSSLVVKVVKFYNNPCVGVCVWSGVGTLFEYSYKGETVGGINMVQAFGYKIRIEDTDHEKFVKFKIDII